MVRTLTLALLLLVPALSGCFELGLDVAEVEGDVLAEHGWTVHERLAPQEDGESEVKVGRVTYVTDEDHTFTGRLDVTSYRLLVAPTREEALDRLEASIERATSDAGAELGSLTARGERTTGEGFTTTYRTWDAEARRSSNFFTGADADLRVLAEVLICPANTIVTVVGQAQVAQQRTVGGQPVSQRTDAASWNEIIADPSGNIQGITGSGLAHSVRCG